MTTATHCSLNVTELSRSVRFYRVLLGCEPTRHLGDYARFEMQEPALVLSLIIMPAGGASAINHLGLRLDTLDRLAGFEARLQAAGYATQREQDVECCYSRQTKFWVADPDGTHWELYVVQGEATTRGQVQPAAGPVASQGAVTAPRVWTHRLAEPVPARIGFDDASVDEVLFEGTLNRREPLAVFLALAAEAARVLKPGGRLSVHGLVASRPLPAGDWRLPGPAVAVQRVPVESEAFGILREAGFVDLQLLKLSASAHFCVGAAELREQLVAGVRPAGAAAGEGLRTVVYRGPLARLVADDGTVFERGQRSYLGEATFCALIQGPLRDHFVVLGRSLPDGTRDPADDCC